MHYLVFGYLLIINAIGFILMLTDKHRARKKMWRIPESTLFAAATLGGSLGCILGMYCFRHKTRHLKFTLGMPLFLIVQTVLVLYIF